MFKTINECNLELVSYTVSNVPTKEITLLQDDANQAKEYIPVAESNMDFMPCSSARVSFGNEDRTGQDVEKDRKLMRYLADHKHMTPFEYQHATFLVEVPLFIRSQIHRHRTFSYNEISRRYTDENIEFWIPDTWRGQSKSNRQASDGAVFDPVAAIMATDYELQCNNSLGVYEELLANGLAREQARAILPQSLLTKFYMGGNLRNFAHFVELRRDLHAQQEVQVVANRIAEKLRALWPESCTALGI